MINVNVQKEASVKYFVVAIKFYVSHHYMVVIVLKEIVLLIIVLVLSTEENVIHKDAKIAIFKNMKKFDAKI
jgi:hypothetical protein